MPGHLALALWVDGQIDEARHIAAETLAEIDWKLTEYTSWKPLFLTRRAEMLGILGRFDEATSAVAEARKMPLCEGCTFCSCKDADLTVARLLAFRGELKEALAMSAQFKTRWPGEEEFEYLDAIVAAKGVR